LKTDGIEPAFAITVGVPTSGISRSARVPSDLRHSISNPPLPLKSPLAVYVQLASATPYDGVTVDINAQEPAYSTSKCDLNELVLC
jgi:hypothetical protein